MKEIDEKYTKKIYLNILKAIIIVLYFFILNMSYENIKIEYFEMGTKILTMIFLFISIFIFEKAYKKDDGELAITAIEFLVLSTYTLTTEHITNKYNFKLEMYSLVASYISAIYFVLRSIIVYTKGRKELVQNLSDIKEIVKKEEPVKKEATKKDKDEEKKEIEDKVDVKKEEVEPKKKKGTTKKTANQNKATTKKDETSKMKIGKTKKSESTKSEIASTKKSESTKSEIASTKKTGSSKSKTIKENTTSEKKTTNSKKSTTSKKRTTSTKKKSETSKKTDTEENRKKVKKEVKEND